MSSIQEALGSKNDHASVSAAASIAQKLPNNFNDPSKLINDEAKCAVSYNQLLDMYALQM